MARILFILFILSSSYGHAQQNLSKKSIDELVKEIAETNKLLSRAIGFAGRSTTQYARFEALKKKATKEDLINLTKHENPVVRSYSFWALTDRKESGLFPIVIEHLNDTAKVERQFGCILSNVSVADFYIELLTRKYLITEDYYRVNNSKVDLKEKRILDSLVLHTPNNLNYLGRVLKNHEPKISDYKRIREIVKGGNFVALPALAKYQKVGDVELILSFKDTPRKQNMMYQHPLQFLFTAIENFPNVYFKEYLINYSKSILPEKYFSNYWRSFYNASLKYNEKFSMDILKNVLENKKRPPMFTYHLEFITESLGKYPSEKNKQYIIKVWEEHKRITEGGFKFLAKNDPNKTLQLLSNYLSTFEGSSQEEFIPIVLEFALKHNKEKTIQLIAKNLRTSTVLPFEKFAKFAKKLKSEAFIEPLFYRIENEWNGHVFVEAVNVIIAYGREDLNKKIIPSSRKNKNIGDQYMTRKDIEESIKNELKKKKN